GHAAPRGRAPGVNGGHIGGPGAGCGRGPRGCPCSHGCSAEPDSGSDVGGSSTPPAAAAPPPPAAAGAAGPLGPARPVGAGAGRGGAGSAYLRPYVSPFVTASVTSFVTPLRTLLPFFFALHFLTRSLAFSCSRLTSSAVGW